MNSPSFDERGTSGRLADLPYEGTWSDAELREFWELWEKRCPIPFGRWIDLYVNLKPKLIDKPDRYNEVFGKRSSAIQFFIQDEIFNDADCDLEADIEQARKRSQLYHDMIVFFAKHFDNAEYLSQKSDASA